MAVSKNSKEKCSRTVSTYFSMMRMKMKKISRTVRTILIHSIRLLNVAILILSMYGMISRRDQSFLKLERRVRKFI